LTKCHVNLFVNNNNNNNNNNNMKQFVIRPLLSSL